MRCCMAEHPPDALGVPWGGAQSVNNYEKEVYNGDPGYITAIDPQARSVTVQFPCSSAGEPPALPAGPPQLRCQPRCAVQPHLQSSFCTALLRAALYGVVPCSMP